MIEKSSIQLINNGNIDDLICIVENHTEDSVRLDALCKLEQVNISQIKSRNVRFLENLVESDESVQIRKKALEIVTQKFPDSAFKVSNWLIENEKIVFLFSIALKTLSDINPTLLNDEKKILLNRYVRHYKIEKEEAQFMMDLELLYSESYNALEFGSLISGPEDCISSFDIIESIERNHDTNKFHLRVEKYYFYLSVGKNLRILDLSFLKSKLNKIPPSIGNLKKLKKLYLENHQLSALPSSMEKLTRLKFLSLNNNKFESIPKKPLLNLKKLNTLFLHNNPIKKITSSDLKFIKKKFTKNYLKMGIKKSNATILSLIEIFQGEYPDLDDRDIKYMTFTDPNGIRDVDLLRWNFKKDKDGYVNALGIVKFRGDLLIKHICKLKYLKKLWVLVGNVKNIPNSIRNLKSLKELDFSHNQIEHIPKAFKSLRQIRKIELNHNQIKKIPKLFKFFELLEFLDLNHNQIKYIPKFLNNCKLLRFFTLRHNNIMDNPYEINEKLHNIKEIFF